MTDRNEQLERWWSGLSSDQRAKALLDPSFDELDEDLRTSLEGAGLVRPGKAKDKDAVNTFLKTRH